MLFSTKAEYGVRLMIELGRQPGSTPISLNSVAEAEHLRLGQVRPDLPRGLEAGHARHRDVEHAQVGLGGERLLEGRDAVVGLGDYLHVWLALDQQLQAAAHDAVVVGDEDPHVAPMVSSMVVPSPGSEKIVR